MAHPTSASSALQLINAKSAPSLFITDKGVLSYGSHIQGVLGTPTSARSLSSVLNPANAIDDEDGQIINTFIYVDPSTREIKQAEDTHKWLAGKSKSINLDSYPESLQKNIIDSLNNSKGIFKDNNCKPLDTLAFGILLATDPKLSVVAKEILETFDIMVSEIETERKKYANIGLNDFVERYAFKKHVMVLGPRGGGKTYTASAYLEEKGIPYQNIAGHSGLESVDLLGYYVRTESGALVWMDGPLTAAFRAAQTNKSALFFDEILRTPDRELHLLIAALTPNSKGQYILRTNRIIDVKDGMGVSETLVVPKENFWVIATTNIGADYDVNDMDLALLDRFRMIDQRVSATTGKSIIESCNMVSGTEKFPNKIIQNMLKLYNTVEVLVQSKELTNTINIRYLCEVIEMCDDHRDLPSYFFDLTPNICSRTTDGNINEVEENTYKHAVKSILT